MKGFSLLILIWACVLMTSPLKAEEAAQAPKQVSTITLLPAFDTSGLNLSKPLQQALGQMLYQTGAFRVQFSSYSLAAFTEDDLRQTFARLDTDQVCFAYLELNRISLFLFDSTRPREYLVTSLPFTQIQQGGAQAYQVVQYNLQLAFEQLMYQYNEEQYQPLPGLDQKEVRDLAEDDTGEASTQRAAVTRRLFLEFAQFQQSDLYLGANFGMARFAGSGNSYSMTNFGAYFGYRFEKNFSAELGLDAFGYVVGHFTGRYYLPILDEKYVSLSTSLGVSMVLGKMTDILEVDPNTLGTGGLLIGPGFGVEIPLLGARIRGEVRFLVGSGSVLFGSYGLTYIL